MWEIEMQEKILPDLVRHCTVDLKSKVLTENKENDKVDKVIEEIRQSERRFGDILQQIIKVGHNIKYIKNIDRWNAPRPNMLQFDEVDHFELHSNFRLWQFEVLQLSGQYLKVKQAKLLIKYDIKTL